MKKAILIPSMIFSALYWLPPVLDGILIKTDRFGGTLERIVLLGMEPELFGTAYIFFIPIAVFILALIATLCAKHAKKADRIVYVLPPILAGLPTVLAFVCILAQWFPFDMSLEWVIHPLRMNICFGVWFFACLYLLLKPVVLRKKQESDS